MINTPVYHLLPPFFFFLFLADDGFCCLGPAVGGAAAACCAPLDGAALAPPLVFSLAQPVAAGAGRGDPTSLPLALGLSGCLLASL